jgi:hypothetical protein
MQPGDLNMDRNADLAALHAAISTNDQLAADAAACAARYDIAGLVFIANIAQGLPGGNSMRLGLALDLADYIRGIQPRTAQGQNPSGSGRGL